MFARGATTNTRIAGPKPWGGGHVEHRFRVPESRLMEALVDDRDALLALRGRAVDCLERRHYAANKLEEGSEKRVFEEGVVAAWKEIVRFIDAQEGLRISTEEGNDGNPE